MNQVLDKISHVFNQQALRWLLLSLTTFVLLLYFVPPQYATNDDMNLIFLANGGLSYPSSHLVYTNIILGSVLKHLFIAIGSINWFTVISLMAYYISFYSFTYLYRFKLSMFSLILFEIVTYFITLYSYNYTSIAIAIALFSSFVLLHGFIQKKLCSWLLITTGVLFILASWIRFDSWGLAVLFGIPFYILVFIHLVKAKQYQRIALCGLLFIIVGGSFIFDKSMYKNEQFTNYKQYENILHTINDYEYIEDYATKYADNAQFYVNQGISVNSFDLLRHYTYADETTFSLNRLNAIANHINQTAFKVKDFTQKLATYYQSPTHLVWLSIIVITIIYLFINRDNPYSKWLLISIGIGLIVMLTYIHLNRYPNRIGFALVLLCFIYGLIHMDNALLPKNSIIMLTYLAYAVFAITNIKPLNPVEQQSWIDDLNQLNQDKQHIYLYDGFSPLLSQTFSFNFYTLKVDSIDNTYRLGGWLYQLPANEDILNRNGIDNPFACLIDSNVCYLASNETGANKVLTYLKEHYDENVTVFIEEEYSNFNIYHYQIKDYE